MAFSAYEVIRVACLSRSWFVYAPLEPLEQAACDICLSMHQGPVARSLVSANRWLRGIKMYRFPWYLTLVSANHASSNPGQIVNSLL